ncbi:hypothetical protein AA23498_2626 [Acetobacter nitrogenifigens DSM 23921 = NBRC 105050]|uniref:DUF1330 domain-containing protein n=1 Tax=Acetobacter nitrogenifigens DSM 23921 = NBRC 105050 TaxID=1120919 RepID=A0A511XFH7_9PROT|nr:DUF1330 domain-containing protein [Acetobacter nitrogenifigens]GBQ96380.1 hypothetical protein AA23498_2626 [Acetobacter nitrogenifigens DSM 23921 = NBRC 105050]GEN61713.1 hypothetical protein ANI02nite_35970 [Acetobacter nitrogenifigens DSM 23921 = NBRC 105050]
MTAYFVIDLNIPDPQKLAEYEAAAGPLLEKHGAKVLTRATGDNYDVIEGDWRPRRLVILEYPTLEAIHQFYHDPEFQPAKKVRQAVPGAVANAIAVEGAPSTREEAAYFVIDITVFDPNLMMQFEDANHMVRKHGGAFLVRSDRYDVIEGNWRPQRILIEQFASRQAIHAMYNDLENEPLKVMRQRASSAKALAVDGFRK